MGDEIFVRLRDCFTAGYTLPQYCIDNNIKRPLFVTEEKFLQFIWEVNSQFKCDKRLLANFCFIDGDKSIRNIHCSNVNGESWIVGNLIVKHISLVKINDFDKIILLTKEKFETSTGKVIRFVDLERYFIQQTIIDIPLLNFLQRYPKVKIILTNFPSIGRHKDGREFYDQLLEYGELIKIIKDSKGEHIKTPFDKLNYTNEQVIELLKRPTVKSNSDGSTTMSDDNSPLVKIQGGKRATAYQPEKFLNKIYFFGTCYQYGFQAPFDKTIESYLQKMLNKAKLPYRVENEGQLYWDRFQDMFYNLNNLTPNPGDIIFINSEGTLSNNNLPFCDVSTAFDPPQNYKEIFCTKRHVNELGYKLLAEKYFTFLTENNFFREVEFNYPIPPPTYHRYGIPSWVEQGGVNISVNKELEAYKQTLRPKKLPVGALVMNCNPFTLGHLHLVEYAAAKVVKLYIFVVEEDKSEFPFADRIELVRQGVKNFSNVEVLPSGKFIISQTTFSGYFNKAELQDVAVDSSEDVEIFAKEIAPTLGITIRFAGEEPKDNVTRQYNETMKKILPRYGVEFCEIPRKEFDGEPISASTVREALKNGDLNKVRSLVPEMTFLYLRGRSSVVKNEIQLRKDFFEHLHEQRPEFIRYFTARIDIKLITTAGDFQILSLSDDKANARKPAWFQKGGIGYQIESYAGKLEFITKSTVESQVNLALLGLDVRTPEDYSKRIPYWIDYTKLTINGQIIFDNAIPTWHDKPYYYNMAIKADEEIKIQIEWLPHKNNI